MNIRYLMSVRKKAIQRNINQKAAKRLVVGVLMVAFFLFYFFNTSFAVGDIKSVLIEWYDSIYQRSERVLQNAAQAELEIQKLRLRSSIREAMESSNRELNEYTNAKKEAVIQSLQSYTSELLGKINFSTDTEKLQIEGKLKAIEESAKQAMNNLAASYTPPVETYIPKNTETIPSENYQTNTTQQSIEVDVPSVIENSLDSDITEETLLETNEQPAIDTTIVDEDNIQNTESVNSEPSQNSSKP